MLQPCIIKEAKQMLQPCIIKEAKLMLQPCIINPFTAMLSLWKLSTKVPNLKQLRPCSPFGCARGKICIKLHSTESRFVTGPSNSLFAGMYKRIFQPGNFTGWGSERVQEAKQALQPCIIKEAKQKLQLCIMIEANL